MLERIPVYRTKEDLEEEIKDCIHRHCPDVGTCSVDDFVDPYEDKNAVYGQEFDMPLPSMIVFGAIIAYDTFAQYCKKYLKK